MAEIEELKVIPTLENHTRFGFTARVLNVYRVTKSGPDGHGTVSLTMVEVYDGYTKYSLPFDEFETPVVFLEEDVQFELFGMAMFLVKDGLYHFNCIMDRNFENDICVKFDFEDFIRLVPTEEQQKKYYSEQDESVFYHAKSVYLSYVNQIRNTELKNFVSYCCHLPAYMGCDTPFYVNSLNSPASLGHHGKYKGGYIKHIAGMLEILSQFKEQCDLFHIDWDLLTALIYLHDIGKLEGYSVDNYGKYKWNTKKYDQKYHNAVGAELIDSLYSYAHQQNGITLNQELLQKISECIRYHHKRGNESDTDKFRTLEAACPELSMLKAIDQMEASMDRAFVKNIEFQGKSVDIRELKYFRNQITEDANFCPA